MTNQLSQMVFSISPTKRASKQLVKQKDNIEDECAMLVLAPFSKSPKINFGQLKLNESVERSLKIVNPQEFNVKLKLKKNEELDLDEKLIDIDKQSSILLNLKWKPNKADNFKFIIQFELLNSRLKFMVHAFGNCIKVPINNAKNKAIKRPTVLKAVKENKQDKECLLSKETRITKNRLQYCSSLNNLNETMDLNKTSTISLLSPIGPQCHSKILQDTQNITNIKNKILKVSHTKCVPNRRIERLKFNNNLYNDDDSIDNNDVIQLNKTRIIDVKYSSLYESNIIIKCQKWIRYKRFKNNLNKYIIAILRIQKWSRGMCVRYDYLELKRATLKIQKWSRSKRERYSFLKIKYSTIIIQKWTKLMKPRLEYLQKRQAVLTIQQWIRSMKLRFEYRKRKHACLAIQKWSREMKSRYEYLQIKRVSIKIQQWTRSLKNRYEYLRIKQATLRIQNWTRVMKHRYEFLREKQATIKIQQWIRGLKDRFDYLKTKRACLTIQKWTKEMRLRFEFLRIRRSTIRIQQWMKSLRVRYEFLRIKQATIRIQVWTKEMRPRFEYLQMKQAAIIIQKWTRVMKPRYEYLRMKQAALLIQNINSHYIIKIIKIQRWIRSLKLRFDFLKMKRGFTCLQIKYKDYFAKKTLAALKIQNCYHKYKIRQIDAFINKSAILIQSYWKGYLVRKKYLNMKNHRDNINNECLKLKLKQKECLKERIENILDKLVINNDKLTVNQIYLCLNELNKITKLLPEFCVTLLQSTNSQLLSNLYDFIIKCNRSQPHQQLIHMVFNVFINFIKCKQTNHLVIFNFNQLKIFINLMQIYQFNNETLFKQICFILITFFKFNSDALNSIVLNDKIQYEFIKSKFKFVYGKFKAKKMIDYEKNVKIKMLNGSKYSKDDERIFCFEPDWSLVAHKNILYFNDNFHLFKFLLFDILKFKANNFM